MLGIGPMELVIVGIVAVLLCGSQLPKVARSLGQAIPSFRAGLADINREIDGVKADVKKAVDLK